MTSINELGDDFAEVDPVEPASVPSLPADPVESPVPVPKDDPQIVVTGIREYKDSLHALLQKNKPAPDTPGALNGTADINNP